MTQPPSTGSWLGVKSAYYPLLGTCAHRAPGDALRTFTELARTRDPKDRLDLMHHSGTHRRDRGTRRAGTVKSCKGNGLLQHRFFGLRYLSCSRDNNFQCWIPPITENILYLHYGMCTGCGVVPAMTTNTDFCNQPIILQTRNLQFY